MICFETPRLRVRHLAMSDLDDLAALCADSVAMQYMDDGSVLSREECARWITVCEEKYRTRGYGTSAVDAIATGAFVGFCGVVRTPENDFDEIIYALAQPYWGKGYATEAAQAMLNYVFGLTDLNTIYATIDAKNTASLRMMQKLGMQYEREYTEPTGEVTKVYARHRSPIG